MRSSWPPTARKRESGDHASWPLASDSERQGGERDRAEEKDSARERNGRGPTVVGVGW
jgi:hypothetical protein